MAPTQQQARSTKAKQLAGAKSPKAHTQRYLKSVEPQLREGAKRTLLFKGIRCSKAMTEVLKDMRAMQAPHAKILNKNNVVLPFETDGQNSLEFLTTKNDCAAFVMASTNKKRPNNLVLGRTFDRQVLDMVEVGVLQFRRIHDYGGLAPKKRSGSKPMMLFLSDGTNSSGAPASSGGDLWQNDATCAKIQNLLIDIYRGDVISKLALSGLDHLITFVASHHPVSGKLIVHQRTYHCKLKKNPDATASDAPPLPYLLPCGPDMTMMVRRTQFASPELWKASLRQPHAVHKAHAKAKANKNHSTNLFGETIGRLHISKQNIDQRSSGRKSKALRRAEKEAADAERQAQEEELARESNQIDHEFHQSYNFEEGN